MDNIREAERQKQFQQEVEEETSRGELSKLSVVFEAMPRSVGPPQTLPPERPALPNQVQRSITDPDWYSDFSDVIAKAKAHQRMLEEEQEQQSEMIQDALNSDNPNNTDPALALTEEIDFGEMFRIINDVVSIELGTEQLPQPPTMQQTTSAVRSASSSALLASPDHLRATQLEFAAMKALVESSSGRMDEEVQREILLMIDSLLDKLVMLERTGSTRQLQQ